MTTDETPFGVLSRECFASSRGAGLEEEWRSLWARLAYMWPRNIEVFSNMIDFADPIWGCIDSLFTVEKHCVIAPGRFPKLIHDSNVLFGDFIAIVMLVLDC